MGDKKYATSTILGKRLGSIRSINWESILSKISNGGIIITDCIGPQVFKRDGEVIKLYDINNKNINDPSRDVGFVVAIDSLGADFNFLKFNDLTKTSPSLFVVFFDDEYWVSAAGSGIMEGHVFFPNKNGSIYLKSLDQEDIDLINRYITDVVSGYEIDHRRIKDVDKSKANDTTVIDDLAETLKSLQGGSSIPPYVGPVTAPTPFYVPQQQPHTNWTISNTGTANSSVTPTQNVNYSSGGNYDAEQFDQLIQSIHANEPVDDKDPSLPLTNNPGGLSINYDDIKLDNNN